MIMAEWGGEWDGGSKPACPHPTGNTFDKAKAAVLLLAYPGENPHRKKEGRVQGKLSIRHGSLTWAGHFLCAKQTAPLSL